MQICMVKIIGTNRTFWLARVVAQRTHTCSKRHSAAQHATASSAWSMHDRWAMQAYSKVSKHKSNAHAYSVSLPTLRPLTIYQIWVSLLIDSHPNDKRMPENLPSSPSKTLIYWGTALGFNEVILRGYRSWGQPSTYLIVIPAFSSNNPLIMPCLCTTTVPQYCLFTRVGGLRTPSLPLIMPAALPDFHPNYVFLLLSPIHIKPWLWRLSTRVMTMSLWWHA